MSALFMFIAPSPFQIVVVLVLGVLFFGKNLPEVAKQLGLALMEFKKGMNELSDIGKSISEGRGVSKEEEPGDFSEETEKYENVGSKFEPPGVL